MQWIVITFYTQNLHLVNVLEAHLTQDIQLLDQITTNCKTTALEITTEIYEHISPIPDTETNVNQVYSVKEEISTPIKRPWIIDLTTNDPLKFKLTGKSKHRSSDSSCVLVTSQPKVKKNNEEQTVLKKEISTKNYTKPCTSESLPRSTVSILSNISLNLPSVSKKTSLPKQTKAIKTVVKRSFKCNNCNDPLVSNYFTTCLFCCNRFCLACGTGELIKDYICDTCLSK